VTRIVRQEFDAELLELKKKILTMGGLVEAMIADSLTALTTRDSQLAEDVQKRDRQVDRMEMEADDLSVRIIALRQPAAGDLRLIIAALKVTTDLERMGDLSVNIAERVVELNTEPQLKPYIDLPIMVEKVRTMTRDALDSFVTGDVEQARRVLAADNEVDALNVQVFRELLTDDCQINPGTMKAFGGLRKSTGAWAVNVILTRDEEGDPDETAIRWFLSEDEAKRALDAAGGA